MASDHEPAKLRQAFSDGAITRAQLWSALREHNLALASFADLLKGTSIREVCVTQDGPIVVLENGLRLVLDPNDVRQAPNIILAQGEYEPHEHDVLAKLMRGADTFFDIGANVGWYSLHAAVGNPGCKVVAFEPMPHTLEQLKRNVALNEAGGRISIKEFGLSNEPGERTMYLPSSSGSAAASMENLHPEETSETFSCSFTTLDSFCGTQGLASLDLIKCDVEGAELFVLKGGQNTIDRHKPYIFIEILRKWSRAFGYEANDILSLLGSMGYKCFAIDDGKLMPTEKITESTRATNFFFFHPDRGEPQGIRLESEH